MLEVELKSVVDDLAMRRAVVEAAGATLVFAGRLEDRRYDSLDRSLTAKDEVLRVRIYRDQNGARAQLDWKGPTRREGGYKLREEIETSVVAADALVAILEHLGFRVIMAIDRVIAQYDLDGTMIRFERYPRMDDLVEVEGTPEQIERAIGVTGLPREGFSTERLGDFARSYQARTGMPAVLSDAVLAGETPFDESDA
ncbi:MAG: class IV adenylate cyclase [Gemmatimonadota bacterium]